MAKATASLGLASALVTAATAVVPTDVDVRLGYGTTSSANDYVLIGVEDPFSDGPASAISSDQDFLYAGAAGRTEKGQVNCVAYVRTGDTDLLVTQARMESILDPIATSLRSNPGQSGYPAELLWCHLSVTQIATDQDAKGAWMLVNFVVLFEAQL
jgi:hypothetical protein